MSTIIRGEFAKNMTTEVFTQQRAESFQRMALPRLNFEGQPIHEAPSNRQSKNPTMESQEYQTPPPPVQQMTPPVVEIPDETLSIFYDRAFQKGLDEGRMQAYAEVEDLKRRYSESLQSLINISRQLEDSHKLQLIQLACNIAERIIRQQVVSHPESLLNLINQAIDEVQTQDDVTIVCNVDDYEYLVGHIDQLKQHPNHTFRINLMVDDMLERGDFKIQTFQGSTDWKAKPQIEAMRDVLTREG
jgi:flagellar biosynthesis/type III secretory pathway protein FliH